MEGSCFGSALKCEFYLKTVAKECHLSFNYNVNNDNDSIDVVQI